MDLEQNNTSLKKLESIIEEKINTLESKVCIWLDFIEESMKYDRTPLVYNVIEDLGKTLEDLSVIYIIKASNSAHDQELLLTYVSKALVVNPNLEVKKNYNIINPDIGDLLKDNVAAVLTPYLMIQIPGYDLFNQILDNQRKTYKVTPDSFMEKILIGELKEEISNY
jgi:hypothetical protein